jgi:hypothetical protein
LVWLAGCSSGSGRPLCLEQCLVWGGQRLRVVTTLLVTGQVGQQLDFQVGGHTC